MNRKAFAYFIIIIVILPLGYAISFTLNKLWIKHCMLEALEQSALQVVEADVSCVTWIEEDEIIINERYFDVTSFNIIGTKIILTGLYDEKEKELSNLVDHYYHRLSKNQSSREIVSLTLLFQPLILQEITLYPKAICFKASELFYVMSESILFRHGFVDTPPPKFFMLTDT